MYVRQRQDRTGGAHPRAQKSSRPLGPANRGQARCPKRGIAPACGSMLLFRLRTEWEAVGSQHAWRSALYEPSSLPKDLGRRLFSARVKTSLVSNTFGAKQLSKSCSTRECFWLSSRVRLCSVQFHRARVCLSSVKFSRVCMPCPANGFLRISNARVCRRLVTLFHVSVRCSRRTDSYIDRVTTRMPF